LLLPGEDGAEKALVKACQHFAVIAVARDPTHGVWPTFCARTLYGGCASIILPAADHYLLTELSNVGVSLSTLTRRGSARRSPPWTIPEAPAGLAVKAP
jgi:hypothetical protein